MEQTSDSVAALCWGAAVDAAAAEQLCCQLPFTVQCSHTIVVARFAATVLAIVVFRDCQQPSWLVLDTGASHFVPNSSCLAIVV